MYLIFARMNYIPWIFAKLGLGAVQQEVQEDEVGLSVSFHGTFFRNIYKFGILIFCA